VHGIRNALSEQSLLRKRFPTRVWKPEIGGTGSLGNIQVAYGRIWMMEFDAATIEASD